MTDSKSDSILTAARMIADLAGVPWAHVQRHYRELQDQIFGEVAYLPKSAGRRVVYASPPFVARILLALTEADPERAPATVNWARDMKPAGGDLSVSAGFEFEQRLCELLSRPGAAERVAQVEVYFFTRSARITFNDAAEPEVWRAVGAAGNPPMIGTMGGVISGALFVRLRDDVSWRTGAPWGQEDEDQASSPLNRAEAFARALDRDPVER